MWQLFVEPNDVLLFRDGKPFTAGEDHRAQSLFPPTPFTIQGALRSKVLFDSGVSPSEYVSDLPNDKAQNLRKLIGVPGKDYGQLRLRGPFVARRRDGTITRYFPLPADVVKTEDERYLPTGPLLNHPFHSNMPGNLFPLWVRTDKPLKEASGWLSEDDFRRYLTGGEFRPIMESDLLLREQRLGIALDLIRRSAQEGMLYQMEFLRLREGVGFLIEVEGIDEFKPKIGFLQLGGEARAARYEVLSDLIPQLAAPCPLPSRFKVILLTPAWFSGGWHPMDEDWRRFFDGDVRLISAASTRPLPIGGAFVDDRRRRDRFQKNMRPFLPAGSVLFFESEGEVNFKGVSFTETPSGEADFGQIGFGCVAFGEWDYI